MASRRKPSALKHGLTSRAAREEWSDAVLELAEALIGAAPRNPAMLEAARGEAEAILYLRRVRKCRLDVLEEGTLERCSVTELARGIALELSDAVKCGDLARCRELRDALRREHAGKWLLDLETTASFVLAEELARRAPELKSVADYERRAHSARRQTLRKLDYERVEAERWRVASEGTHSRRKSAACR